MLGVFGNQKVRNALLQVGYVGALGGLVLAAVLVARRNLAAQGMTSGFGFLFNATGWDVTFSLLPVTPLDPYWYFFLIGLINTLFLGVSGLALATAIGGIVGFAQTSSNGLANLLGRTYVDVFRNVPIILQAFFWFAVISHLPPPRTAYRAVGFLLSSRGLYVPVPDVPGPWLAAAAACVLAALLLPIWIGRTGRVNRPLGQRTPLQIAAAAAAFVCAAALLLVGHPSGRPFLDVPALHGLNLQGGLRISPEYTALLVSMGIYGGSYIGEIVRGGFKAVGRGQVEAAGSLGLSAWQTFSLVRLPLAFRAMLPILTNQYVWLIKATTIGIAVGFTDFFMIVVLAINHSGQTIEAIGILMAGFLLINLSLAAVLNRVNGAIALKGNQLRT